MSNNSERSSIEPVDRLPGDDPIEPQPDNDRRDIGMLTSYCFAVASELIWFGGTEPQGEQAAAILENNAAANGGGNLVD